jgi:hypothetical protein
MQRGELALSGVVAAAVVHRSRELELDDAGQEGSLVAAADN